MRPLVIFSAGTLRLGKAEKTGLGTTRLGKKNQQVKDVTTRLRTTRLESPGTIRLGSNETIELLSTGTNGLGTTGLGNTVVGPPG